MSHSNLDIVKTVDSFPCPGDQPEIPNSYVHFRIASHPGVTLGYVLPSVALALASLPNWIFDQHCSPSTLTLVGGHNDATRTAIMMKTTLDMRSSGRFKNLEKWRDELLPVYGPDAELLFSIERSACPLFGVVTYGVHMTAYRWNAGRDREDSMEIWVPRRSRDRAKYPGMLDTSVGGALATGETPWSCLIRESEEEASLGEETVKRATAAGDITFFCLSDEGSGGEEGLAQPERMYIFDLDLTGSPLDTLAQNDGSVEAFELLTVSEVKRALSRKEFKPNSALVLIDFLIRHGQITPEDEPDYQDILLRLHRNLEFPVR
ncbi:thiamine pyrophosphokinase-related protein-like protein [Chaetomium sp. MPI-SDFR-AT-0129]|nr:thiamine pyrophosphokinase-related protein-like protein [Chaetomium sp. MPI-SDFR-AT-0129]